MARGFHFDLNRCTGCEACRLACSIENELPGGESWRRIETFNPRRHPAAPRFHLSLACLHCADPPCLDACPARAYHRDGATGAVLLDSQTQIMGISQIVKEMGGSVPGFQIAAYVICIALLCVIIWARHDDSVNKGR